MSDQLWIALIGALVSIINAGIWVEVVKNRKQSQAVEKAVTPNSGTSMRDAVDRVERSIGELKDTVVGLDKRTAIVEAILKERKH